MFVTTFYSYKGGVGRTMALANVAAELSRRGKSVLLVDFDLEAPGVSSFSFNNCTPAAKMSLGLVDFVHYWIVNRKAPEVTNYLTTCPSTAGGTIWIMPAGLQDEHYGSKLQDIDWADLYENLDGFVLLEDLKRQWERVIKPDYVLIDSRTGHTDIGGICTRQLPDLVTFVFWPNVQNLTGLKLILAEMDSQERTTGRHIKRLFVPSNLPTIDDEDEILKEALEDFQNELDYDDTQEIRLHNYQSIDLLRQVIFTTERSKSSLAHDYRRLADAIMKSNTGDETGVKLFLTDALSPPFDFHVLADHTAFFDWRTDSQLEKVITGEWNDPGIYKLIAMYHDMQQDPYSAILALRKAIDKGENGLNSYVQLARLLIASPDREDAPEVVSRILSDQTADITQITTSLRLFSTFATPSRVLQLTDAPALVRLNDDGWQRILSSMRSQRIDAQIGAILLKSAFNRDNAHWKTDNKVDLALTAIAGGEFELAIELLGDQTDLAGTFNLAMAHWGLEGKPSLDVFDRITKQLPGTIRSRDANLEQCSALVELVFGRSEQAKRDIALSRAAIAEQGASFSCWSYLVRRPVGFIDDLNEMTACLESAELKPTVFVENWSKQGLWKASELS